MERKIGEIFNYQDNWYQCIKSITCTNCGFNNKGCLADKHITGDCSGRLDGASVIFRKLEKFGEPYEYLIQGMGIIIVQEYILANASYIYDDNRHVVMMDCQNGRIAIEIKQNKEDMKEKKLNLKPFDLEAAKAGKPVCTRDGRKARIICFDRNWEYPIVALIECENGEEMISACDKDGKARIYETQGTDLMIFPEKKEGWIIIHKEAIYDKETAEKIARETTANVIRIQKIEWEE